MQTQNKAKTLARWWVGPAKGNFESGTVLAGLSSVDRNDGNVDEANFFGDVVRHFYLIDSVCIDQNQFGTCTDDDD